MLFLQKIIFMNSKSFLQNEPMESTEVHTTVNASSKKTFSWSSVFAGTVTVLAILLVLNLIGVSIGLFSFDPASENNPASGLGIGSSIWWIITNIIALFLGGFVAGRLSPSLAKDTAIIHGFITWALYALVSVWLITSTIGSIFSGLGNLVGGITKSATGIAANAIAGTDFSTDGKSFDLDFNKAKNELQALLRDTERKELQSENLENKVENLANDAENKAENAAKNPEQADTEIDSFFDRLKNEGRDVIDAADKDALVNIVKNRTDMSEEEVRNAVDQYEAKFEELKAAAKQEWEKIKANTAETAEQVTDTAGSLAIWAAIALIIGAIASIFGGLYGSKMKTTTLCVKK